VDAGTVSLVGRLCHDRPTRNNLFELEIIFSHNFPSFKIYTPYSRE
jgi:hypothetical protein